MKGGGCACADSAPARGVPVLSVKGLTVEFRAETGTNRALDGLSYDLYPGKTLAIVGESGCGKSIHALSMLRLLPGTARAVSGEIIFRGADLLKIPDDQMRALRGCRMSMIFQEPMTSLNPVLTIGEQIAEAVTAHEACSRAQALEKAAALLEKAGISEAKERLNDYPHRFSGGMRQRVMIAIALACNPDVLIADEPTTALDVTIQAQILRLLRDLQKERNMSLVLITHNLGIVADIADDVVVMYAGRSMERAGVEELFKSPANPYTEGLLNSIPSLHSKKERLQAIPGQPPGTGDALRGCSFSPRCKYSWQKCFDSEPPEFPLEGGRTSRCWMREPGYKEGQGREVRE